MLLKLGRHENISYEGGKNTCDIPYMRGEKKNMILEVCRWKNMSNAYVTTRENCELYMLKWLRRRRKTCYVIPKEKKKHTVFVMLGRNVHIMGE